MERSVPEAKLTRPPFLPLLPLALLACAPASWSRTLTAATVEEIRSLTRTLAAGDTLLVKAGEYDMTTWDISGRKGTDSQWVVIRAEGRAVIRSVSACCNLVQMSNLEYVAFQGFEITLKDQNPGIDGINLRGGFTRHLRLEDLNIHHVTGNGISMFPDSAAFVTLRNSEIAHTEGSGLYWGYPGKNVLRDARIEGNYFHHCPANPAQANHYGIQFKGWSYRSRIANNVLHDVGGTTRSGLIVYYGKKPLAGDDPADVNVVAGNALWNCRNEGITVMSDAIIENNVVMDAGIGINIQAYNDESFSGNNAVENLQVRNNTVFRCRGACISVGGWGAAAEGTALTGNAAYQDDVSKTAFSGSKGSGQAQHNVAYGRSSIAGTAAGNGLGDFLAVTASGKVPTLDFYPAAGSALLDIAPAGHAETDFNGGSRPAGAAADAGAYERREAKNPGWVLGEAFKGAPVGLAPPSRKSPPRRKGGARLAPPRESRRHGLAEAWTLTRARASAPDHLPPTRDFLDLNGKFLLQTP